MYFGVQSGLTNPYVKHEIMLKYKTAKIEFHALGKTLKNTKSMQYTYLE